VAQDAGGGWTWGRAVGNPAALGLLPSNYILPLSTYQEMARRASALVVERGECDEGAPLLGVSEGRPGLRDPAARGVPLGARPPSSTPAVAQSAPLSFGRELAEDEEEGDCSQS